MYGWNIIRTIHIFGLQKFAQVIIKGETIQVFKNENHPRDFTYIDDIVKCMIRILDRPVLANTEWSNDRPDKATIKAQWCVYNISNCRPVNLMEYINALEKALRKETDKEFLPSTWRYARYLG